ncbi:MAG: tetratricopeptide repeat protein [Verrucomicrobiota bacterium]
MKRFVFLLFLIIFSSAFYNVVFAQDSENEPAPAEEMVVDVSAENDEQSAETVTSIEEVLKKLRPSEDELFSQASDHQSNDRPREALPIYIDFLRYYPEGKRAEEVLFRTAECYRALGRFEETRGILKIYREKYPKGKFTDHCYLMDGEMYAGEEMWKETLEVLQKADSLKEDVLEARALYLLIIAAEHEKRLHEFTKQVKRLATIKNDNPYKDYARLKMAELLIAQNKDKEALNYLSQLVSETANPQIRSQAAVKAGNLSYEAEEYLDAVSYYETVRRTKSPEYWRKLANLGLIQSHFALGNYLAVSEIFRKEENSFPEKAWEKVLFMAAEAYRLSKKSDEALALYNQILLSTEDKAIAEASNWAWILLLYDKREKAKEGAEKDKTSSDFIAEATGFLETYPQAEHGFQVKLMLSEVYYDQKDYKNAQILLVDLLENHKNQIADMEKDIQASIWYRLGYAGFVNKDFPQAKDAFEVLISEYKAQNLEKLDTAYWMLGLAYQQEGEIDQTLSIWSQLLRKFHDFSLREEALWRTGILSGSQKQFPEMREFLEELILIYPDTKYKNETLYWLAIACEHLEKKEDAKDYWRKAREADPNSYFEEATKRLLTDALKNEDLPSLTEEVDLYEKWSIKNNRVVPIASEIYEWMGQQYVLKDKYNLGEIFYRKAFALTSGKSDNRKRIQLALCLLMDKQGNHGAAIKEWERYRKDHPEEADRSVIMEPLAKSYIKAGSYDKAEELARQILKQNPEGTYNAKGRMLLGDIAFAKGDYQESGKIFSAVALLIFDDQLTPEALKRAEEAYRRAGYEEKADEMALKLRKKWKQ